MAWAVACAVASLCGVAVPAVAEPALHAVGPAPGWVEVISPEAPNGAPSSQVSNGVQYLLLDRQLRVTEQDKTSFQHIASRVINEHGLENVANIEIRFDPSYQKLTLHSINVRRGGQVFAKLPNAKVKVLQRESALESLIYDGSRTAHVFLEDVRVGDVVEYAYSVRGSNPVFGNRHFGGFELQYSAPVSHLHLRLLWPAGRPIYWTALNGAVAPTTAATADGQEFRWDLRGVESRRVDSDAPSWFDPFPAMQWSEFKDWQDVVDWAIPLYALSQPAGPRLQAAIAQIAGKHATQAERLLAALRYVQGEVRYLGIEVGPGSHAPNAPELVLERRYGDCKDKTLLTMALLRGLGIEARPALVSTDLRQAVESQRPSPGVFNHVLVRARLGQRDFWLDPTRTPQRGDIDQLVQADYGRALVIDGASRGLVPMAGEAALASRREVHAVIDSRDGMDQPVRYTVTTTAKGAAADSLRSSLDSRTRDELQKQYLNYYTGYFGEMEVVAPILVIDEHQANEVTVKESYLLKEFWQSSTEKKRREASVATPDLSDYLQQPRSLVRNAPLSLAHPTNLHHVTELLLPGDWSLQPEHTKVVDPAFEHERQTRWNGSTKTLTLLDSYQSHADHVDAADMARYAANLEKARHNVSYVLYRTEQPSGRATEQSLHWVPAVVGTLALVGFGVLGWRLYQWDPEPGLAPGSIDRPSALRGIGGWLILPAIGLPVTVGRLCLDLHALTPSWSTDVWYSLANPAGDAYHPLYAPLLLFELVGNLGLLMAALVSTVLFFRRRSSLPRVYVALLLASLTIQVIDSVAALQIPAAAEKQTAADWVMLIRTALFTAIWMAYFIKSERVKLTFVERLRRPARAAPPDQPAGPTPQTESAPG